MKAFSKTKKDREVGDETAFIKNGGMLLEKLIGFCNGKCNPIRGFSAKELERATNNYELSQVLMDAFTFKLYKGGVLWKGSTFTLYKGFLQDRPILVKKFTEAYAHGTNPELAINEIPFASHMSVHKNVLKLLGCCLETEIPILVFESVKNGTLHDHLYSPNNANFHPLLWKHRLKIAVDMANVVTYLHTAFPKPIIHRSITPKSILLDENYVAKLTDFSLSISIPDGETHVGEELAGTSGYIAPEHFSKGVFNEKIDVFSFGICLLVLLTGKTAYNSSGYDIWSLATYVPKCIEDNRFNEIIDPIIVGEGPWPGKDQELQSFAALAVRCTCKTEDNRPAMIDIAKELRQIYRSRISPV